VAISLSTTGKLLVGKNVPLNKKSGIKTYKTLLKSFFPQEKYVDITSVNALKNEATETPTSKTSKKE